MRGGQQARPRQVTPVQSGFAAADTRLAHARQVAKVVMRSLPRSRAPTSPQRAHAQAPGLLNERKVAAKLYSVHTAMVAARPLGDRHSWSPPSRASENLPPAQQWAAPQQLSMYSTPMRAPCVLLYTCAQAAAHRTQLAELATGWPQTWHMRALASSLCAPMRPLRTRRPVGHGLICPRCTEGRQPCSARSQPASPQLI